MSRGKVWGCTGSVGAGSQPWALPLLCTEQSLNATGIRVAFQRLLQQIVSRRGAAQELSLSAAFC